MPFVKATKQQARLRLALIGPAGSGKTYTALNIAQHLGAKVALVDTERGSASKYADLFSFDVMELESFHPQRYIDAVHKAEQAGYDVLIIDSLSHAWAGKDGALELVDKAAKRTQGNSFAAWREVTPIHNALVDTMIASRLHLIVTMRSKTEWVVERDERTGKTQPRKVGLAPVQRDGLEYEFDVVADMDIENNLIVSKTRCPALAGAVVAKPGKALAETLRAWLTSGASAAEPATPETVVPMQKRVERAPEKAAASVDAEKPITPVQRDAILKLAGQLVPGDEDARAQWLFERYGLDLAAASKADAGDVIQKLQWAIKHGKGGDAQGQPAMM